MKMLHGVIIGSITVFVVNWLWSPVTISSYSHPLSVLSLPECPSEMGIEGAATWATGPDRTGRACVWDSGINNREWGGLYGARWTVYAADCSPWQETTVVRENSSNWVCVEYAPQ